MPEERIVEPRNARNAEYRAHLDAIQASGKCPFCPGGDTYEEQERLAENDSWIASRNYHPLPNTSFHFLFTPKRHVILREELTAEELKDLVTIEGEIKKSHGITGSVMFCRDGEPMVTGATVIHLHFQMIVPDVVTTMYFGPKYAVPQP